MLTVLYSRQGRGRNSCNMHWGIILYFTPEDCGENCGSYWLEKVQSVANRTGFTGYKKWISGSSIWYARL